MRKGYSMLLCCLLQLSLSVSSQQGKMIHTVRGPLPIGGIGTTLVHEHFLVDFIGADKISAGRWNRDEVVKKVLPFLQQAKAAGVRTIFDCTPAYLGRDPQLLRMLADASGMQIVTNTGYYGAQKNKFLPAFALTETAEQLAARWIAEFEQGIEDSPVKPGFIKIGVDDNPDTSLSEQHIKLVRAAALTHLETGLTICSHTGRAPAAFEQLKILSGMNVPPDAFVWVHAQAEKNTAQLVRAAKMGCWVSLDGIGWGNVQDYIATLLLMKEQDCLHRVLISQDAGWYKPGEKDGGQFNGFLHISEKLVPLLMDRGFTEKDINLLLVENPATAFSF